MRGYLTVLRGDIARLERCTEITTGGASDACGTSTVKRSKPFKYAYEKEIVMSVFLFSLLFCAPKKADTPEKISGTRTSK
jgi:cytoplasmic tRNA 2-thiolation protein 1